MNALARYASTGATCLLFAVAAQAHHKTDTTMVTDCPTLTAAVTAGKGVYISRAILNCPVTITLSNTHISCVDGGALISTASTAAAAITVNPSLTNVVVKGCEISGPFGSAITVGLNVNQFRAEDCNFRGTGSGVIVNGAVGATIVGNRFTGHSTGVSAGTSTGLVISRNRFANFDLGITMSTGEGATITGNEMTRMQRGMVYQGNNGLISGNQISLTSALSSFGISVAGSATRNAILDNRVVGGVGTFGIGLGYTVQSNIVQGNTVLNHAATGFFGAGKNNVIKLNHFNNNCTGIDDQSLGMNIYPMDVHSGRPENQCVANSCVNSNPPGLCE